MKFTSFALGKIAALSALLCVGIAPKQAFAAYLQSNLVSNNPAYNPQIIDPYVQGSLGIDIRRVGTGGHFWINNSVNGTVTEYVGDVGGVPLYLDDLKVVDIPASPQNPLKLSAPTGQVFNSSKDFVVNQNYANGEIIAPSKFLFASLDGTISGWADKAKPNGTFDRPKESTIVIDHFGSSIYYGLTVSDLPSNNRLYAVDFGDTPGIDVFDGTFADITSNVVFSNPFVTEGYAAYNIQALDKSLYVTYAQPSIKRSGDEKSGQGLGKLAQFDFDGNLLNTWDDSGLLNVPAGLAIAPVNFGKFSNALLVANFGDGTITGFDRNTRQALGYLPDTKGNPIVVPRIWGLTFGNGASLGEANHLYFAASPPDGNKDGLFGKLQTVPEPSLLFALLIIPCFAFVLNQRVVRRKQHM